MRVSRRLLLSILGLAVVVIAAAGGIVLATRGDDDGRKYAGRIAVVDGCGLLHPFADGSDQKRLCLSRIWASASVSDNGRRLAWDTVEDSQLGIAAADLDVKFTEVMDEHQVPVPTGANVEPALSPDGSKLAFLHSPQDDGRYDIWTTSSEALTEEAEQVTATRDVSYVVWSPAGDWLAYVKDWSEETLQGEIVVVRPSGDDERQLGRGNEPSWAPDGKQLVLVRDRSLWTVAIDGSQTKLLVRNAEAPAWSRDGKRIAFMRAERCGNPICRERVFLVFADGTSPQAVGPAFMGVRRVLWLPDPDE